MEIRVGETYGRQKHDGTCALYTVTRAKNGVLTLQNVDVPGSVFDTTAEKLERAGYRLVSQAPYVAPPAGRRGRRVGKPSRCPHTVDFIEGRADKEKPSTAVLAAGQAVHG
jgi:hypothetical protein